MLVGRGGPVGGGPVLPELRHPVLQPAHVPGAQDALLQHAARGQADPVQFAGPEQQPVAHQRAHLPGAAHQPRHRSSLHTRAKRQRPVRPVHGHWPAAAHRHRVHRPVRRHAAADRPGPGAHQVQRDRQQQREHHTEGQLAVAARAVLFAGE